MATHSSVLGWRISGTGEPCGLPSMGSHRVGHDWSNLAPAAEPKNCVFVCVCVCVCVCIDKSTYLYLNCCCCLITKLCLTLCDPMNYSMSGFHVLHDLPEFAQTRVLWVSDAIQSSHPLSPSSPLALNLSYHQGLFQWVGSSYQVAKVLELQLQFFQWIFRLDFLKDWPLWSLCCPRDSQESSPTPQLEGTSSLMLSLKVQLSHPYMSTEKKNTA